MAHDHSKMMHEAKTEPKVEGVDLVISEIKRFAKKKGATINRTKHHVLETGHPSPLSANRGLWFGNKHFSKTNTYLQSLGKETIKW